MKNILNLMVYFGGILISREFCRGYWVVGSVFAFVWVFVYWPQIKNKPGRILVFFPASVLTYAFVSWLEKHGWHFEGDLLDVLFGSLSVAVAAGSIFMPFLHSLIFPGGVRNYRGVSLLLIASWYLAVFLSSVDQFFNIPGRVDYLLLAIAMWQGIYLRYLKAG